MTPKQRLQSAAEAFIAATNAFDAQAALALFAPDAIVDDPSTGRSFIGHAGIGDYVERYFIGYRTVTRLLSLQQRAPNQAVARVDFTGDFGHEIGLLDITLGADGRIVRIDADLE